MQMVMVKWNSDMGEKNIHFFFFLAMVLVAGLAGWVHDMGWGRKPIREYLSAAFFSLNPSFLSIPYHRAGFERDAKVGKYDS